MFLAVCENGVVDMKPSFERLYKSEKILFFAQAQVEPTHIYYNLINYEGKVAPLPLNGCKIHRIIQYEKQEGICVVLEIESPIRGIERVAVYQQPGFFVSPLMVVANAICKIDLLGYDKYCER